MTAFSFVAPLGGAINFRGITGSVLAMSEASGDSLMVPLDHVNALPANRLIVQCRGGSIADSIPLRARYSEVQFFLTPTFKAGKWSISKKGVSDEDGEKVATPSGAGSARLGFELHFDGAVDANPIWVNWMATSAGKSTIELRADGKAITKINVMVENRNASDITNIKATTDIVLNAYVISRLTTILVGDIVTIPLTLADVTGVKELLLTMSN